MAEGNTSHHGRQVGAYITRVLSGMAQGLFASLIIGLIIKQIGHYSGWLLLEQIGLVAQYLTGPAIGVGVALAVKAPMLGVLCSAVAGAVGAGTFVLGEGPSLIKVVLGEPFGAMLASLAGAEISKKVVGKTGVDIIVVPLATILGGSLVGHFIASPIAALMTSLGAFINLLTTLYPLPMGILVSTVVGMVLTLPISSAAICISLGIDGLAAGAAVVGCSCQIQTGRAYQPRTGNQHAADSQHLEQPLDLAPTDLDCGHPGADKHHGVQDGKQQCRSRHGDEWVGRTVQCRSCHGL